MRMAVISIPGVMYNLAKKIEIAEIYIDMYWMMFPVKPSQEHVGANACVSPSFTERFIVVVPLENLRNVTDTTNFHWHIYLLLSSIQMELSAR